MQTVTVELLHSIESLKDVPEEQLHWMIDNSEYLTLKEEEFLYRPGQAAFGTNIIISGKIHLYQVQNQEIRDVNILEPKDITGYLPFSRGTTINIFG